MGGDFNSFEPKDAEMKGKLVISKTAAIIYVVITALIILAVGLLAGLVGRPQNAPSSDSIISSTTTPGVIASTTTGATTPDMPQGPWSNVRLPNTLIPLHYVVDLQPNLAPVSPNYYMFNGSSSVSFTVNTTTKYIIIHSNKLNYSEVSVTDSNDNSMSSTYMLYEPNQFLVVTLDQDMTVGQTYTLSTKFYGELGADLGGLYRSSYTNSANDTIVIATTQMQPTDARKAFPCFDEPALKATFDVFLWHKDPNFALSNMPNVSTVNMYGDWKKTEFQRTVKMSTYLLAFVVCDFDYVQNFTQDGVQTRIYARPEQIANGNGDYAKKVTPVILDYFETYFNVTYPLPKSDQIAVPDFAAGAMENWGLIIYRETALLYDPAINSASNKQRVAAVVAHELAHQWFGNLISPLWWDELWLNEGFASYVEYLGTDIVEPTWRMMDQFVVSDLHSAMSVDGLTTSRPIVAENVQTPADINALFDTISYSKGACIIRMINEFTGVTAFKLGLKNYLDAYAYGPVDHNQLFEFWGAAVNATPGVDNPPGGFINAMDTWMLQMGYPVITMSRVGTTNTVRMTQQRFLLDPAANQSLPTSPYSYKWDVPFWYSTKGNVNKILKWLQQTATDETIQVPSGEYYIGNYEAFGYYRVNYDVENWKRITDQLNSDFSVIGVKSRGQLIDDAFNLARAGKLTYDVALGLTPFLSQDFDYIPWESALDVMSYFDLMLGRSKVYGVYSQYLLNLVQPLYDDVTWVDSGDHLQQYQRINAIGVACKYGNPNCVANASSRFADWIRTGNNSITANLRTTVYCNAIAYGGVREWDFAWEKYQVETNSQERAKIEYALSCTQTPWIIRRFLDFVLNDTYVRGQDSSSILQDLCYNEYARDITWDYIRERWDFIYDTYGTGFFSFSGIISSCTSHFSTEFELQELQSFINTNSEKLGSGRNTAAQAVEKTKTNINWRAVNEDVVFNWLLSAV